VRELAGAARELLESRQYFDIVGRQVCISVFGEAPARRDGKSQLILGSNYYDQMSTCPNRLRALSAQSNEQEAIPYPQMPTNEFGPICDVLALSDCLR
jgi:hypothetical protein